MTVAKLRYKLHSIAEREPEAFGDAGATVSLIDELGRFGDMAIGTFVGLLGKVKISVPKPPPKPKMTDDQKAAAKAEKGRIDKDKKDKATYDKAEAKRVADAIKAQEKAKIAEAKAEQKRLDKERNELEKKQPTPEIKRFADELNALIERAKREQATYAEIDGYIARMKPLSKPQLLQVAEIMNSHVGLAAKPKGENIKKLGDTLRRVLGTAERKTM